jgi:hypothetical protein
MTAHDAKASYDKIINPPADTTSFRKAQYEVVESFLAALASPLNWIYKADILARDIRWRLLDQWRQIGVTVRHEFQEPAQWDADRRAGNFEVVVDTQCGSSPPV